LSPPTAEQFAQLSALSPGWKPIGTVPGGQQQIDAQAQAIKAEIAAADQRKINTQIAAAQAAHAAQAQEVAPQ
jgi:hypothetical protein